MKIHPSMWIHSVNTTITLGLFTYNSIFFQVHNCKWHVLLSREDGIEAFQQSYFANYPNHRHSLGQKYLRATASIHARVDGVLLVVVFTFDDRRPNFALEFLFEAEIDRGQGARFPFLVHAIACAIERVRVYRYIPSKSPSPAPYLLPNSSLLFCAKVSK